MRRLPTLALLVLVVLSGCTYGVGSKPVAPNSGPWEGDDRLGWEGGYAYDANVTIAGDSVTPAEREAMIARAMARIEHLRGLEFQSRVPVTVINRSQYVRRQANKSVDPLHSRWNDQVWEALFLVGADRNVSAVMDEVYGSAVQGFYSPSKDEIVIISDGGEGALSRSTLVHELAHALQDQQFGIDGGQATQDAQLARNSVLEGEATRITSQYERRCGESWDCVTVPGTGGGGGGATGTYVRNVLLVVYQPYATGPNFVQAIEERGGHDALNALYSDLPASTEQVLHPEKYPDELPVNVTVPNRASGDWHRFDHDPVADTVGEASIFAMVQTHELGETRAGRYSYHHPVSEGWGGDAVVPYTNGEKGGYVWETAWDTRKDATEFHEAYLELLRTEGATQRSDGVWTFPDDSPWQGAYRVVRDGKRVRVVHGPTVASLDRIHAR